MALSDKLKTRLLGAIDTGSLIFLCGAGLSMAPPSNLPGAKAVANDCYDKWVANEVLPAPLRDDIDALAGHFHARGEFESVFLNLISWGELEGSPNPGHATISDLLVSRAAHGALSANFDTMIEKWARDRKVDLQGALTGQDAINFQSVSNPLVKFHGCMTRARELTLWTHGQLTEAEIQARVTSCSQWMTQNLPSRHLVVVGFWTDWGYLNNVLADAFTIGNAGSVTVVDPSSPADLQAKAADLWAKLNGLSGHFEHVQQSGAEFLEELRVAYSRAWTRKFYALGKASAEAAGVAVTPTADALSIDELYKLRLDSEGRPYNRAATWSRPMQSAQEASLTHFQLLNAGASQCGAWWEKGGASVRVINGAGQSVSQLKSSYSEPPAVAQADVTVCAGSFDLGLPGKIISPGAGLSVVKPLPGGVGRWLTRAEAAVELGL